MNVLGLSLVADQFRHGKFAVRIEIDGVSLIERVQTAEAPWRRALHPNADPMRPLYSWMTADDLLSSRQYLLGTIVPRFTVFPPGLREVLVCSCGERGCAALGVSIRAWPQFVAWTAWRRHIDQGPRDIHRPLLFNRTQYEAELGRVLEELAAL